MRWSCDKEVLTWVKVLLQSASWITQVGDSCRPEEAGSIEKVMLRAFREVLAQMGARHEGLNTHDYTTTCMVCGIKELNGLICK